MSLVIRVLLVLKQACQSTDIVSIYFCILGCQLHHAIVPKAALFRVSLEHGHPNTSNPVTCLYSSRWLTSGDAPSVLGEVLQDLRICNAPRRLSSSLNVPQLVHCFLAHSLQFADGVCLLADVWLPCRGPDGSHLRVYMAGQVEAAVSP